MPKDWPSKSELFGTFDTLSDRLDDLDPRVGFAPHTWRVDTLIDGATVETLIALAGWGAVQSGFYFDDDQVLKAVDATAQTVTVVSPGPAARDIAVVVRILDVPGGFTVTTGGTQQFDGSVLLSSDGPWIQQNPAYNPDWDARRWETEALAAEWAASTDLVMKCYPTAADMDGSYDGTWQVVNGGNPSGTLPPTPAGIDMRGAFILHLPYRDADLAPGQAWPYQQFREILSQTKAAATGGDLTEWAVLQPNTSYVGSGNIANGMPVWFYESTLTGDPGEGPGLYYDDGGQLIGVPLIARMTQDTASETATFWRAAPYPTGDPAEETTADGWTWVPIFSRTDPQYASMDPNGVETWKIGIQNRMDVRWMSIYEFGGAQILDITPAILNATTPNTTTFTDGVGNTIQTVTGTIA
jgi:hypothetical protein